MRRASIVVFSLLLALLIGGCGSLAAVPPESRAPTPRPTAAIATIPAPSSTVEPAAPTAMPARSPAADAPAAARVVAGGNVRNLPTTKGSVVLDKVDVGETVLLRMRLPDEQWYSIVTPRGIIGWSWVGLLDVPPAVAAVVPAGTDDAAVITPNETATPESTAAEPTDVGAEPAASETAEGNPAIPTVTGAEPAASEIPASGSLIAYTHEGDIWLISPATGETRQATYDGASSNPAWTADGRGLVFTVQSDDAPGIYTLQVGESEPRLLAAGSDLMHPAVAPDGQLYYVRHIVDESSRWEIVRHDAAGDSPVVFMLETGLCAATDLRVSNTHWMLALGCGRNTALMVGELAGGEGTDLGQQLGGGGCLAGGAWSKAVPQRLIVIQSSSCDAANAATITGVDVAGGTPDTEPTYLGQGIYGLDTSPDGREIVFAQFGAGGISEGLWTIDTSGQSAPRQIAPVGADPAWRP